MILTTAKIMFFFEMSKKKQSLNYIHTSQAYIFFIDTIEDIIIGDYIRAFCFSPAPLPRYLERASLNFQVRLTMNVRRVGFSTVFAKYLG